MKTCPRLFTVGLLLLTACLIVSPVAPAAESPRLGPPEGEITAPSPKVARMEEPFDYRETDQLHPPPQEPVLFIGSSTTARWKLKRFLPGHPLLNRGVGGTQMADMALHVDRLVTPYAPRTLVIYQGDNDVYHKKTAAQITNDAHHLAWQVLEELPECTIVFLAVKPSPRRAALWPQALEVNAQLAEFCSRDDRMHFVDLNAPLLLPSGEADPGCFVADMLHLNPEGYARWSRAVDEALTEIDPLWAEEAEAQAQRPPTGSAADADADLDAESDPEADPDAMR